MRVDCTYPMRVDCTYPMRVVSHASPFFLHCVSAGLPATGDIQNAMENQIKSERTRRSTVLEADGERESAVIKSRGDAAQMVRCFPCVHIPVVAHGLSILV